MHYSVPVSNKIHWIGVNDRRKRLFENLWPLERGVSYNSFLIVDEKTALVDTIDGTAVGNYIERIEQLLNGRPLDYLIVNHMEPDHSGEVKAIIDRFKGVKLVGNVKTFKIVEAYWGITEGLIDVEDGRTLDLGYHKLKFLMTPWVHWPETMMTYDTTDQILFTGDAFGSFGAFEGGIFDDELDPLYFEDEARRYYSNIVGKYSNMVQKAIAKLEGIPVRTIAPTHGPVWRSNPTIIMDWYNRWSRFEAAKGAVIIFASMYGNTEDIADYLARRLCENGVRNIRVFDVSKTHISYLISEIWKFNGLVLGSCAYNSQMFPLMEQLTHELLHIGLKSKHLALFGSYSWNGGGVKNLAKFAGESELNLVSEPLEIYGKPTPQKLKPFDTLAETLAHKILE
ncbi:MAG: FprA family A-type flavoprotein [Bacteroidales bacterium]|jgi:flavorubredoxin|nr:FprA family A-type flavoprotein [Bacteroidales bacterium]HNT40743.1 FprA family A-type flavoprotein [Tenuifilaceae bacterium]MBP8642928.1 FprA family A-type flavoprotein [Bacteroidales bacterium]HOA09001.1 FprA family A-type flavoprotein [Tenuifilaceae bacterium]HOC35880.1 FprA family A-type flavoprotein [Tenuifilaceae bacterium]